jgi:hypothetical protein
VSCRFTELIIDAEDPHALAVFWRQVLGYEERDRDENAVEIAGPPGTGPSLVFLRVPERKSVKNRLHIDVNATDRDQVAELERLLSLGARPVDIGQGDDVSWHVLADPEGNEFCLLGRRVDGEAPWPPPM